MDFLTLKKDNKKKYIIGSIVVIGILSTITYIGTRAKYRMTSSMQLATGTINYEFSDLELVAVKLQNDSGEYISTNEIPSSGYTLNKEKSICKVGENKVNVSIEYKGKVYIGVHEKGTKCTLYFDKSVFKTKDLILSQNTIDSSRISGTFTSTFEEDTSGRIFNSIDDAGETYFFAGSNPNNWVNFAGYYWRIIRINGDESIRMIYNGPTTDQEGETTQIGTSKWSHKEAKGSPDFTYENDNAYVGYMYGTVGSNNYEETHTNTNSSEIKNVLDTWYEKNLKKSYEQYIDQKAGFCGDRQVNHYVPNFAGNGSGITKTKYASGERLANTYLPTYKCTQSNDLYTTKMSIKGNKALENPIGLITSDEVVYAGGLISTSNKNYYLYTGNYFWTLSPFSFSESAANNIFVHANGSLNAHSLINNVGVRPVINLKADTLKIGSGTTSDPYRIS